MINIAVCDDEVKVLDDICRRISKEFSETACHTEIFSTANAFEVLEYIKGSKVDVLFLDIDMPNLNGMDIAQTLIDNNIDTLLIFVTSHDALVYKSFKYHPFGFIRKSHFDEEIAAVVRSIVDELRRKNEFFTFKTNEGFFKVLFSDIIYFESESNYINLHCTDKIYRFRGTISSLESELAAIGFVRTHKGFLVNQQHIFAVKGNDIRLSDGEMLPIGRTNRECVKKTIMRYMR